MNGIKFKDFVREIKKYGNEKISVMQNDLDELMEIEKEFRPGQVSETKFDRIFQVFNSKGEKLYNELKANIRSLQQRIYWAKESVSFLGKIIGAFDHDKAVGFIDKPDLLIFILLNGLSQEIFNIEETTAIFGSSVFFNSHHMKGKNISDELKKIMIELGEFYNADGSFKPTEKSNFEKLINDCATYNPFGNSTIPMPDTIIPLDTFIRMTAELQRNYMNNYKKEEKAEVKKEAVEEPKTKNQNIGVKLAELREYYKNMELIKMPNDLEYFKELLNDCKIDEKEQQYIISLVKKAIKAKPIREDSDDKDLQGSSIDPCSTSTTNIIFLKDVNNNNYFLEDLEQLTIKYQDMVMKALTKINHMNKNIFRPVIINDSSKKLYEVYSSDAHVIFYPLEEGIYLVIGASIVRDDYDKIINRFTNSSNRTYIEQIKAMLQNPKDREKLLAETVYPPDYGQKRTRQK